MRRTTYLPKTRRDTCRLAVRTNLGLRQGVQPIVFEVAVIRPRTVGAGYTEAIILVWSERLPLVPHCKSICFGNLTNALQEDSDVLGEGIEVSKEVARGTRAGGDRQLVAPLLEGWNASVVHLREARWISVTLHLAYMRHLSI